MDSKEDIMASEENVLEEVNVDEIVDLTDEQLDEIAGGAGPAATKPCPICGNTMTLKGSAGHYVYFCKSCKKVFKA